MADAGVREEQLPEPLTAIVGRTRELKGVAEALRSARLVTVAGPGGVGKTRLGLEAARRRAGGVWLVDLTATGESPDVPAEVARALGIGGGGGASATDLLRHALAESDALLLLDNCDHVVRGCAELAGALLECARSSATCGTPWRRWGWPTAPSSRPGCGTGSAEPGRSVANQQSY